MVLPPQNLLSGEASPYLRQHAENPVHWRPWSTAALEEARQLDRPILLSVGYAACHWCHVMAHESFEDADIAGVMNRLFVNIKVDREERPDIDQIYMAALTAMGDQGGWPLTMFLTPDAKPFWGGTYFPPRAQYGRHGFVQILEAVAGAWNNKRADILHSADTLNAHVQSKLGASLPSQMIDANALPGLATNIYRMIDHDQGGIKGAPKFPNAPFMHTLWLSYLNSGNTAHKEAIVAGLCHMLAGGIYDHVGGGLTRYSTDAQWLVPHFEKMLYDNAQLLRLANWAYGETGTEIFRVRIEETIGFLLREMRVDNGAFASSLDADSDGEEGLFYTWKQNEIEAILGENSASFFRHYTLSKPTSWHGKPILHQSVEQAKSFANCHAELRPSLHKLLIAREKRIRPGRDDKILTDWNGLTITALAECGRSFACQDWIDAARTAFDHILCSADNGRLPHSTLGDKAQFPAMSSDYAAMANAAISLYEATWDATFIEHARHFVDQLELWHADEDKTGYYLSASDSTDVPIRIRGDVDEAIPSATSQIIEALARLSSITGDVTLLDKAWKVGEHAVGRIARQAYGQAGIINACEILRYQHKLVMVESQGKAQFVPVANRHSDPRRVDIFIRQGDPIDISLPGGISPSPHEPGAYLCKGQACLPPVKDGEELEQALKTS